MPARLALPLLAALIVFAAASAQPACGADRVELEIATEKGAPITAGQEWAQLLNGLDLSSVQIRGSRPGDKAEIRVQGSPGSRIYHVTGILSSGNQLQVPGHRFRASDRGAIAAWVADLIRQGPLRPGEAEVPFGLRRDQYLALRRKLGQPLENTTAGQPAVGVANQINEVAQGCFYLDSAAIRKLSAAPPLADELQGLAAGAAMAATLRSAGLGATPRPSGGKVVCSVVELGPDAAVWPVGLGADERSRELLPILYEFLNVEIDGVTVAETVDSIAPRLKVPVLYDRLALAVHEIDPAAVTASLPAKRTSYSLLLKRVLFQARLKYELRVDDAGRPFVWITTVKKI